MEKTELLTTPGSAKAFSDLSIPRDAYKAAVEEWITAIKAEEGLATVDPSVAQVDTWEQAHFKEEEARDTAQKAKQEYEAALRQSLFHF